MNDFKIYDTSFVQKREWMLYKIREDHYPFNVPFRLGIQEYSPYFFQKIIDKLVERHEILRTRFRVIDGSLKQLVFSPESAVVKHLFFDLSNMGTEEQESFIEDKTHSDYIKTFNLEYGPIFRVSVFKASERVYYVNFVFHHVIFDQPSSFILERDAKSIWQALTTGNLSHIPENRCQYREHASYENRLLENGIGNEPRAYWEEQLVKGIPKLGILDLDKWEISQRAHIAGVELVRQKLKQLPFYDERFVASITRRAGFNQYRYNNSGFYYQYSDQTIKSIKAFKNQSNSSMYTLFLASFVLALHKMSQQELIAIEVPASRRIDGIYKQMIGWISTGGVCFFDVKQNTNIKAFLAYIDKQLFLLSKNCVYPYETMGYEAPSPVGSEIPVFFTLTEYNEKQEAESEEKGVSRHEFEGGLSYQDITIFLSLYTDSCKARLGYDSFIISPDVMEELMYEQESHLNLIVDSYLDLVTT